VKIALWRQKSTPKSFNAAGSGKNQLYQIIVLKVCDIQTSNTIGLLTPPGALMLSCALEP
jgi:hypothetical protein